MIDKKIPITRLAPAVGLTLALLIGLGLLLRPELLAADPPNQPFDLIYQAENVKYSGLQVGAGTFEKTSETVYNVAVTGPVVKAYLLWAGLGRDNNGVAFQRDGGEAVAVAPDHAWNNDTFGASTWNCCGNELSVYVADITSLNIVTEGNYNYTLSDMDIQHTINGGTISENWGYSLLVIYEDETLATQRDIYIKLGNDGFYYGWGGLLGPNSDVQCLDTGAAGGERSVGFNLVIGGVENEIRPNGLWTAAGSQAYVDAAESGTWNQNQGIIDLPDLGINGIGVGSEFDGPLDGDQTGNGIDWPFSDFSGDEWDEYPPFNVSLGSNQSWACVQVESMERPELPIGQNNFQRPASIGFLGFIATVDYLDQPAIVIEKATNGEDADEPAGPMIAPGDTVTWTYAVTNTSTVTLTNVTVSDDIIGPVTCPADVLPPGASMTCTMTGTAMAGQYANLGSVIGTPPQGEDVTDDDPSHYFGGGPAIVIEKATNGEDADEPTGPMIAPGDTVTWTYVVTNTGAVTLTDVTVTDDIIGPVTCPAETLAPGASMTCTMTGTATAGQYANLGSVVGTPPQGEDVTDNDPSHYFGSGPAIDIEKATNGEDADDPTGPIIPVGGTVTWTYVVTNVGNAPLTDVTVTDDIIGAITCPQDTLAVGESMTCTAAGTSVAGQYENLASVVGTGPNDEQVTDEDPSHYFGAEPAIDIEKATNGEDADAGPGPTIPQGDPVTWTYVVTNIGNVPLSNVSVVDSVEGTVTCPQDALAVGESMTCTLTGTADTADYANDSSVTGTGPTGQEVTDEDPSHYTMTPTAINDPDAPEQPTQGRYIFLPIGVR
ncbi:MAG: hypothetical protein H6642_15025 [Caldilineaceae bacterium]|nr:hypothetical protein [Caldilineaceae bacterium]